MTATPRHALRGLYHPVRTRFEIVRDYARAHNLTVRQVRELVAELPGGEERK